MKIVRCILRSVSLPLRDPMRTSYGIHKNKHAIIVILRTRDGHIGIAECVAMKDPTYTEETLETAWHVLREYIIPSLRGRSFSSPSDILKWSSDVSRIRGNRMAKASIEMALWDALSSETQTPLHTLIGGALRKVPVGISLGMDKSVTRLVEKALCAEEAGYRRIKLKIAPGDDYIPLRAVREAVGDIAVMADANSSYTLSDVETLESLDALGLAMIEQPLAHDDLVDHAELQRHIQTPICLDESIRSAEDTRRAMTIGAGKIINLKPGRVGGFGESIRIHEAATREGWGLWCGGMYETGIGRLHNLALMSLPSFNYPTDNGPSSRYFVQDLVSPQVTFSEPGYLEVESLCGVASRIDWEFLEYCSVQSTTVYMAN